MSFSTRFFDNFYTRGCSLFFFIGIKITYDQGYSTMINCDNRLESVPKVNHFNTELPL